jgi:hypothetical protein
MGNNNVVKKTQVKKGKQPGRVTTREHGRAVDARKNGRNGAEVDEFDVAKMLRQRQKAFQVKAEDGKLIITLALFDTPTRSSSGKSLLVATSSGIKRATLLVNGSPVHVVASAFIYEDIGPPVKWEPLFELPKSEDEEEDEAETDTEEY